MKKAIFFFLSLFLIISYCQQLNQEHNPSQEDMQYLSMRRTACLSLSRYHANTRNQQITQLLKEMSQKDQQSFINKLYAVCVQTCQPKITNIEVQQFFIRDNQNFDPTSMFFILEEISYNQILDTMDKLTPNQEAILKFIKSFDQQMQIRKEEQEDQRLKQGGGQSQISVFGLSGKDLPPVTKYIYLSFLFIIMGAGLWYGFSQIGNKPQKKSNKRRKKQ